MEKPSVTIVGGGVSGLACAYWLDQLFPQVSFQILERSQRAGGKIQTRRAAPWTLEAGPDNFVSQGPTMLHLCGKLGLEGLLQTPRVGKVGYLWNGQGLERLPASLHMGLSRHPWMALLCSSLSPLGKLRAALEGLVPTPQGADERLGQFVRQHLDLEADKSMASPLSGGLFSTDASDGQAVTRFPEQAIYRQEAETARPEVTYRTFQGGMQVLVDRLAEAVRPHLRLGVTAESLQVDETGWLVTSTAGEIWSSQHLMLALPLRETAHLMLTCDAPLGQRLLALDTVSGVCVSLGWERPPAGVPSDGYGFVSQAGHSQPVLAATWSDPADTGSFAVRAFLRSPPEHSGESTSADHLTQKVVQFLTPILGLCSPPAISQVDRYEQAFPALEIGNLPQLTELESLRARHLGLHWTGPAFGAAGIPHCVLQAHRIARAIHEACSGKFTK